MVCLLTPNSRPTSAALRPASICFSAPIISTSVYFLFAILPLSLRSSVLPHTKAENHISSRAVLGEQVIDMQHFAVGSQTTRPDSAPVVTSPMSVDMRLRASPPLADGKYTINVSISAAAGPESGKLVDARLNPSVDIIRASSANILGPGGGP